MNISLCWKNLKDGSILYDSQVLFARMQSRDPLLQPGNVTVEYTGEVQRVTVVLRPISRALVVMVAVLNQPVAFMEPPPKL
jgi:DNA-directed RNA polymerase subunit L